MSITLLGHAPLSEHSLESQVESLQARGCAGQTVSLSFSLRSPEPVRVVVHSSPGLEAFWVKVWEQPGLGLNRSAPRSFPELLLKNDVQPLRGHYRWRRPGGLPWRKALPYYEGPDVCLDGSPRFTVGEVAQQVWLTARLPGLAGHYQEEVTVQALDAPGWVARIPVQIEVLPFCLLEPGQDRLIWYKGTLDPYSAQHSLSRSDMEVQLRDIWAHGFCSLTIHEKTVAKAQIVIDMAESIGFDRHAVLLVPHPIHRLRFRKLKPVYYLSDEFDGHGPEVLHNHRRIWQQIQGQAITMASVLSPQSLSQLGPHPPDIVCCSVAHSTVFLHSLQHFPHSCPRPAYYYWPAHLEKPCLHRILSGVGLWQSGADGISPYCYQHLPHYPADPFDDRQPWEPGFTLHGKVQNLRHHLTTYPGKHGVISTLQWEAFGEGIWDLRYLTTWEHHLNLLSDRDPLQVAQSRSRLREHLAPLDMRLICPGDDQREPLANFSAEHLDRLRDALIEEILNLRERLQ